MAENTVQLPEGDGDNRIKTAAEFREKYSKKRFTSHTAPKAVLYSFLYDIYQQGEGGVKGTLYPDITGIQQKVETYEDMDTWNGYLNLVEWQRSAFNTAVFMRNSLQGALSDYHHIVTSLIAAENLRADLRGEKLSETSTIFLSSLTLEAYAPQSNGYTITTLRKNIEASLRYMIAYNAFIELIAEELKTPEYVRLKVLMRGVHETLNEVNRALALLRDVANRERAEEPGIFPTWSQEYLQETLRAFEPVGEDIPPVPEDRVAFARDGIRRGIKKGQYSWYTLYQRYSSQYWRVNVYE